MKELAAIKTFPRTVKSRVTSNKNYKCEKCPYANSAVNISF